VCVYIYILNDKIINIIHIFQIRFEQISG
jgi:hypothetical protein